MNPITHRPLLLVIASLAIAAGTVVFFQNCQSDSIPAPVNSSSTSPTTGPSPAPSTGIPIPTVPSPTPNPSPASGGTTPFTVPDGLFKAAWPGYSTGGFSGSNGKFCAIANLYETDYTQAQYDAAPVVTFTGDYQSKYIGGCLAVHFVAPVGLFKATWPGYPMGGYVGSTNARFCVLADLTKGGGFTQAQYDSAPVVQLNLDYQSRFDGACP